jgi:histidine triad (HIT) family protein
VKPEKPVAYRTLDGNWFCVTCWWELNRPATPFYSEDFLNLGSAPCRGCDAEISFMEPLASKPCVFCDIIAGDAPVEWIVRPDFWPDAVAFTPLNPVTEGHALIVPKVHVQDFTEDPEVFALTARRAAELMRFSPRAMNVLSTRGTAAGQEVMHLHLHLIPREKGDGIRLLTKKNGTTPQEDEK